MLDPAVGGVRQIKREFEIEMVRRRNVEVGVQRTASSDGVPLMVKLHVS